MKGQAAKDTRVVFYIQLGNGKWWRGRGRWKGQVNHRRDASPYNRQQDAQQAALKGGVDQDYAIVSYEEAFRALMVTVVHHQGEKMQVAPLLRAVKGP